MSIGVNMIFPTGRKNRKGGVSNRPKYCLRVLIPLLIHEGARGWSSKRSADRNRSRHGREVGICAVSSRADLKVSATAVRAQARQGRWIVAPVSFDPSAIKIGGPSAVRGQQPWGRSCC